MSIGIIFIVFSFSLAAADVGFPPSAVYIMGLIGTLIIINCELSLRDRIKSLRDRIKSLEDKVNERPETNS